MYKDTVHLHPGCYSLKIYDTGGDGLSFWANTAQGSGQLKLKKLNTPSSVFFKYVNPDFGNFSFLDFIVNPSATSITEIEKTQPYFMAYPNPATDHINVEFNDEQHENGTLTVMNMLGETMYSITINQLADNVLRINTGQWPQGIYFIKCVRNGSAYTEKVIISR